tara:strand:+ start:333 stop:527 length:195 start_codon:yes stop_codon:yes gene_type:complete
MISLQKQLDFIEDLMMFGETPIPEAIFNSLIELQNIRNNMPGEIPTFKDEFGNEDWRDTGRMGG